MSSSIARNTISFDEGPNPQQLIKTERQQQKIDPVKMHWFLEGSKERSDTIKRLQSQMERDPILATGPGYYDTNKSDERETTATKIARVAQYLESESFDDFQLRLSLLHVFDPQVGTRIGVNLGLFLSCIRGNGTADQLGYWALNKETCYLKNIYGCFGMTELAHGSNVMALQTTATFDQETDEFVINTPHIGATKWWIGGAAHSATHCTVYARLIVKGEDYGVKTFVVPLRDSNHNLMPGVTVGDIGAKMGRGGIDNGWIQFSHVRIPRYYMLQKFARVSADGEVTLPPLEQLAYSALLGGRVMMVLDSYRIIAKVVTISLRYAIGRRQFHKNGDLAGEDENTLEEQIINYPLHQRRLFPYLAAAYVVSAGALKLEHTIHDTLAKLDDAVDNDDEEELFKGIEAMKSLFIDSGALKATLTWLGASAIDECRQACGGHGYSAYNAFGKTYDDWVVQCTWEGDNNILGVFTGKPIVKHLYNILDNEKVVKGSCAYLNNVHKYTGENWETPIITSESDVLTPSKFLTAIEVAITRASYSVVQTLKNNGDDFDAVGAELKIISKLHAHRYLLAEYTSRTESTEEKDLVPYLKTLGNFHAVTNVLSDYAATFLQFNVLTSAVFSKLNVELVSKLCKEIRPHVVGLTDSFQQSDMLLNAPIGNYDGNIYENYFSVVKAQNPPVNTKASYTPAFAAMLNRGSLDSRQRDEKSYEVEQILSKGIA